jgi:hypothetical protein
MGRTCGTHGCDPKRCIEALNLYDEGKDHFEDTDVDKKIIPS